MAPMFLFKHFAVLSHLIVLINGQTTPQTPITPSSIFTTSPRPQFTLPAYSDEGAHLIANVKDPLAVNAQHVCPGYKATHVKEDEHGLTALLTLAGRACNVYGNDVQVLNLKVEYQAANRLAVNISPEHIVRNRYKIFLSRLTRLGLLKLIMVYSAGTSYSASQVRVKL